MGCSAAQKHGGFRRHIFASNRWFWTFSYLIFLSGCGAKPECDSFETRDAVLKAVSDDHKNALGKYAAENSTKAKSGEVGSEAEKSKQQPLYRLGEKIVTTSTSDDKRTLTCSGSISAIVGDTKSLKRGRVHRPTIVGRQDIRCGYSIPVLTGPTRGDAAWFAHPAKLGGFPPQDTTKLNAEG